MDTPRLFERFLPIILLVILAFVLLVSVLQSDYSDVLKRLLLNEISDKSIVATVTLLLGIVLVSVLFLVGLPVWHARFSTTGLVSSQGLHIFRLYRDGARWIFVPWSEVGIPTARGNLIGTVARFAPIVLSCLGPIGGLVAALFSAIYPPHLKIFVLSRNRFPTTKWTLTSQHGWIDITFLTAHCWHHWLAQGEITIDPDYAPSSERNLILLDLWAKRIRAYPLDAVDLGAEHVHIFETPEGTQEISMKVYAIPIGNNYWFSADWGIHERVNIRIPKENTPTDSSDEQVA